MKNYGVDNERERERDDDMMFVISCAYQDIDDALSAPSISENEKKPVALDEGDISLLKTYGIGPYTTQIKKIEVGWLNIFISNSYAYNVMSPWKEGAHDYIC